MSKPKFSDAEKEIKKLRDNLVFLHNRVKGAFNLKSIVTWADVYKHMGVSVAPSEEELKSKPPLTFQTLKEFLDKQTQEQEVRIKEKYYNDKTRRTGDTTEHDREKASSDGSKPIVSPSAVPATTGKSEETKTIDLQLLTEQDKIPVGTKNVPSQYTTPPPPPPPVNKPVTEADKDKDYGYVRSKNADKDFFPYWFQKKATKEIIDGILIHKKRGQLLLSSTGTGKTFITGDVIRHLEDVQFHNEKTWASIPYIYITRATVVEQTKRVLKKNFNLGVEQLEVINIEQLRSAAGRLWVFKKDEIVNGEDRIKWIWKPNLNPCVVLLDECQAVKNDTSTQHQIMAAYNDLPTKNTFQVFISATPFTRVSEAKCFAVSTHHNIEHLGFPPGTVLTNETWPAFAAAISYPSAPDEYNEAAVERLMKELESYVVRVKGVRPQFDAINGVEMIDFETKEEADYYHDTERRYMEKKAKMEAMVMSGALSGSGIWPLVLLNERCMAAELCRKNHLAKKLHHAVQEGYAGVCALKYKATMIAVVKILVDEYGYKRSDISLVWGGGQTQLTDKQKAKANIKLKSKALEAAGMDVEEMLKDLDLDEVEDRIIEELDPSLKLGPQSPDERQSEIDRFQSGKSVICLYTFKAGGVGLSLHHSDEHTKDWDRSVEGFEEWHKRMMALPEEHSDPEKKRPSPGKVRHKSSGYAVEEDIKFIPVRQRRGFVAPTYSAIELVQGLGRAPRLTSLSNTVQTLLFYRNTVEVEVSAIVSIKLRCLSKVVRQHESWQDVISDTQARRERAKEHLEKRYEDDTGDEPIGTDGEDEE